MGDIYGGSTPTVNPSTGGVFNPAGMDPGAVMPGGMGGSQMTYSQVLEWLQYQALTGQLLSYTLRGPNSVDMLIEELGLGPNVARRFRDASKVRIGFGVQITSDRPQYGDGLTTASIRAREGSLGEDVARGNITPEQLSGGTSYDIDEIWTAPWRKFNAAQYEQMQHMMYDAGFYSSEAPPIFGDRSDPGFRQAWFGAVQELYAQGNTMSLDEFLSQKAQTGGPEEEGVSLPTQIIELTDAATIRTMSDEISQGELGRKMTDEQKAFFTSLIHQVETQQQQAGIDVETQNYLAEQGINLGLTAGTITADMVLRTTDALAAQYGLVGGSHIRTAAHNAAIGGARNSDHLTGMARDISGPEPQMAALAAWAHQNEGPGKLFRWVGWKDSDPSGGHDDHVHLSFNSQVGSAAIQALNSAGGDAANVAPASTGNSGLEGFMAATRSVESGGDYNVVNSIGAMGAYQFMPGTWASAAAMAGINPGDHSAGAQDAAARALMSRYYQMYGDWRLVAVAWHGGEGLANRAKNNFDILRNIGDGNISTYDYVQKVMGAMAGGGMGGPIGPNTTSIMGVDVNARLQEEIRKKFPTEAKAHDVALQFDTFRDVAFRGLESGFEL